MLCDIKSGHCIATKPGQHYIHWMVYFLAIPKKENDMQPTWEACRLNSKYHFTVLQVLFFSALKIGRAPIYKPPSVQATPKEVLWPKIAFQIFPVDQSQRSKLKWLEVGRSKPFLASWCIFAFSTQASNIEHAPDTSPLNCACNNKLSEVRFFPSSCY